MSEPTGPTPRTDWAGYFLAMGKHRTDPAVDERLRRLMTGWVESGPPTPEEVARGMEIARKQWAELGRLVGAPEDVTDPGALLEFVKERHRDWIDREYRVGQLKILTKGLEPLCPCNVGPDTYGPEQDCPLHGDQETFVAYVRELEATRRRAVDMAQWPDQPEFRGPYASAAKRIVGEVES